MKKILLHKRLLLLAAIPFNVLLPMEKSKEIINSMTSNKTEIDLRKSFDEYCIDNGLQEKNSKRTGFQNTIPGLREFSQLVPQAKIKFENETITIVFTGMFRRCEGLMQKNFTLTLTPKKYEVDFFKTNIRIFYGLIGYITKK